jgi:hypothetical protein
LAHAKEHSQVETAIEWEGTIESVQPRIRLMRSFDQRSHNYLGYVLRLEGACDGTSRAFLVAIGPAAHAKHQFRAGDRVRGLAHPVADRESELAEFYKASKLSVIDRGSSSPDGPPWRHTAPPLETYRERGHLRLDRGVYDRSCTACVWGCLMAVDMIIDHWNPSNRRSRTETFCYGPLDCPIYRAGPKRKVPGRRGMSWTEEDWVDEQDVEHRRES